MKLKQRQNIFHVIVNANSIVEHVHLMQIKNGIMKHVNVNVKNYRKCKKDYSWNPSICICENSNYLEKFSNCIWWYVVDILPAKTTNTIATNVAKNCHSIKVRDCYIFHTVLLTILLLLIIILICYYSTKHRSKQKAIDVRTI